MTNQIRVFSTKGEKIRTFDAENVNTFAELKVFLKANNVEFENFNATQAETKISFSLDNALLSYQNSVAGIPTCTIVLTPKSQKAG